MLIEESNKPFPFAPPTTRTEGIHVSDIIKSLEEKLFNQNQEFTNELWKEAGFIWERALEQAWGDLLGARPGEIVKDGIIGSPDGIYTDSDRLVLREYKCTWKSTKNLLEDNWRYMTQVKAYCYMIDTVYAEMFVLYLNGNYRPPEPIYKSFDLRFTEQELEANWNMLLKEKEGLDANE